MSENIAKLDFEYVPLSANIEHINRHFAGSFQPGSKFLPMTEEQRQEIIDTVDRTLRSVFTEQIDKGKSPERVVLKIKFDRAVGTDALTEINPENESNVVTVIRDAGTEFETPVKLLPTNMVPEVDEITVVAGRYGPTQKWGIFTMFPGTEAPPFPNPSRQKLEALASNEEFWRTHGFLATPQEIEISRMPK